MTDTFRPTAGLHHVTAICGDAQATVDFYVRVLGLRLLKRTVNFDDPTTYHLYFGDRVGRPGTALTFFAWSRLPAGRPGTGQAVRVAFRAPEGSLEAWRDRLEEWGAGPVEEVLRFGRRALRFRDPDGLGLALVEHDEVDPELQWSEGPLSPEMAVAGFHGVALLEAAAGPTAAVLTGVLGMEEGASEDGRTRFLPAGSNRSTAPTEVTVVEGPDGPPGRTARGSVHHIAFRAADGEHQGALRSRAAEAGLSPTPVIDRYYFESVYFREPGGVLLEVATDGPGFMRDQDPDEPAEGLSLPPWLEKRRDTIEEKLVPVEHPDEEAL